MGLFRLTLAFCVVLSHGLNIPIPAAGGDVAVQTFYIVSGFYMGLVLTEKYHRFSSFFTNRLLRLYPAYFAVAGVTLAHALLRWAAGRSSNDPGLLAYETHFAPLGWLDKIYLIGTNVVLWGQDVALFLKVSPDGRSLDFTTNFAASTPQVEDFLLVPQAWSLSIELGFYLLAPWLVRRSTGVLVGLLIATIAGRVALASAGLAFDPWTYRFFPVEIGSFVLGMLVYRSMRTRRAGPAAAWLALCGLLTATLTLSALPGGWAPRVVFYAYVVWALPLAFQATRTNRFDRYLGELSYPVYLSHLLVISVALYSGWSGRPLAALIVLLVIAASVLIHELVQKPVDRYRATRVA
jgi:peptidoglycan/LPS O-acetylase OafA/YrhL